MKLFNNYFELKCGTLLTLLSLHPGMLEEGLVSKIYFCAVFQIKFHLISSIQLFTCPLINRYMTTVCSFVQFKNLICAKLFNNLTIWNETVKMFQILSNKTSLYSQKLDVFLYIKIVKYTKQVDFSSQSFKTFYTFIFLIFNWHFGLFILFCSKTEKVIGLAPRLNCHNFILFRINLLLVDDST
jgi:hypothetical protein